MKNGKLMTIAVAICVAAAVVLPSPAGTRPYELDWANRTTDDRPVLLPLVSAAGWTCETTGATACFTTACERVLFGDGVAHLAYKIPGEKGPTCCSTLVVSGEKTASVQQQDGWIHFAKGAGLFPVAATKGAKVRFHRIANSLVADIEAPVGVEEVRFGCMEKPDEVAFTPVPYYKCGGNGDGVYRRPCVVTAGKGDGRPCEARG